MVQKRTQTCVYVFTWCLPPNGWVALNVDGSVFENPESTRFGGLIRDQNGHFIRGFYGSLGAYYNAC